VLYLVAKLNIDSPFTLLEVVRIQHRYYGAAPSYLDRRPGLILIQI